MRQSEISSETLNAYVDGELARGEAAAVARAAAHDPAIAARIATLREMKAAIGEMALERDIALPAPRTGAFRPAALAVAAGVAMMVFTLSLYTLTRTGNVGLEWAKALEQTHTRWSHTAGGDGIPVVRASGPALLMPLDLKSARLKYVGRQELEVEGRRVQRIGYEGTRGCRVSLYVYPADVRLDRAGFAPSLLVRVWVISDYGYALMADGMALKRFESLAVAVERALRQGRQFDPRTRQRLALARRTSPPCQA